MTEEQEKMIWCEPSYMKEFRCTADKCSDTCCAGWEIVLDDDALERYEQTEGSFGKRLRREKPHVPILLGGPEVTLNPEP